MTGFNYQTRLLRVGEPIPYDLLLLADEFVEVIDRYLFDSEVYVYEQDYKVVAVYALYPISAFEMEIKNIAVDEAYQNKGIGKLLLMDAECRAKSKGCLQLLIGTPDIAAKQLSIYQKAGFIPYSIKKDFFTTNYPSPIFEDGMLLQDMIMLRKQIA